MRGLRLHYSWSGIITCLLLTLHHSRRGICVRCLCYTMDEVVSHTYGVVCRMYFYILYLYYTFISNRKIVLHDLFMHG